MPFATGNLNDLQPLDAGEVIGNFGVDLPYASFDDGVKVGRFARDLAGVLKNLNGSASPVMAGVVTRAIASAVEDAALVQSGYGSYRRQLNVRRVGLATVYVRSGETPTVYGRVYVSNLGDANDGMATASNTDVPVNAEFLYQVQAGVWVILLNMPPTDMAFVPAPIADPGNAGAIPVGASGECPITTAAAETRTLARPTSLGQVLAISFDVRVGNCVITSSAAFNTTGNNTITLTAAGQSITLVGVQVGGAKVWRVLANDGATLTTV